MSARFIPCLLLLLCLCGLREAQACSFERVGVESGPPFFYRIGFDESTLPTGITLSDTNPTYVHRLLDVELHNNAKSTLYFYRPAPELKSVSLFNCDVPYKYQLEGRTCFIEPGLPRDIKPIYKITENNEAFEFDPHYPYVIFASRALKQSGLGIGLTFGRLNNELAFIDTEEETLKKIYEPKSDWSPKDIDFAIPFYVSGKFNEIKGEIIFEENPNYNHEVYKQELKSLDWCGTQP